MNDEVVVFKNNKHYRYGDLIYQLADYRQTIKTILSDSSYSTSLLCKILNDLPEMNLGYGRGTMRLHEEDRLTVAQLDILAHHIAQYILDNDVTLPQENELIVHLRLGDICYLTDSYIINQINNYIKVYPDINTIVLVAVLNYDGRKMALLWENKQSMSSLKYTKDFFMREELPNGFVFTQESHDLNLSILKDIELSILSAFDLEVRIRSNSNVDEDLAYMSSSKYPLIHSRFSGFSSLCEEVREYNSLII